MDGKQFAKLLRKRDIKVNRFEFHGREFNAVIENGRVEVTDKETGETIKRK